MDREVLEIGGYRNSKQADYYTPLENCILPGQKKSAKHFLYICFLLSNLGFALLGQVLGQRFANGYEEWMRNNMLLAFDMSNTYFALDDRYIDNLLIKN